jgi:hypothetical protein
MTAHHSHSEAETKQTLPEGNENGKIETMAEPAKLDQEPNRPTPLTWLFVCIGLYLGALLYGKEPLTSSLSKKNFG